MMERSALLIQGYGKRLGSLAADPIIAADVQRLAEHEALAEVLRGGAELRGEPIDVITLNMHERTVRRLRTALGLD